MRISNIEGLRGKGLLALTTIFLVDNGSLRPEATKQLRKIAAALSKRLRRKVEPVSLLHSSAIPASQLGGREAEILNDAVLRRLERGAREFVIVPLFFGRSRALTVFIPELMEQWKKHSPEMTVRIAAPLAARGDDRLARILERQVRAKLTNRLRGQFVRVALVDHGSPVKVVTQVRNRLASQLRRRLGSDVAAVAGCSMEIPRRGQPLTLVVADAKRTLKATRSISHARLQGLGADPIEPLLENVLAQPHWNSGAVIVAQLFLLPGRHAGAGGDVEMICQRAREESPGLRTVRTKLVGEDPGLIAILADRFGAVK
ncbi:MAG: CbiX/SirB N-terminal domain-containing protein [Opitutaceae bacterium]